MYNRLISLDKNLERSFFLWGPRQSGKSTILREKFADAHWVDLLQADQFLKYQSEPHLLRQELRAKQHAKSKWIIIDEIQKVPLLLNEVHLMIEQMGFKFGLSGSSVRKLRHGQANLLGGRAQTFQLFGLSARELGDAFNLDRLLQNGYLPPFYDATNVQSIQTSYAGDYLREEVAAEGLVRRLPAFSEFLRLAALSDTELVSFTTIARDVGVSSQTIKDYYQILVDTLIGYWLPPYRKKSKRRLRATDKFYFSDVGVVNFFAKRNTLEAKTPLYGKAFENWVAHELFLYKFYRRRDLELSYWGSANGEEVDFILNDMEVVIEAKATTKVNQNHLKGLQLLQKDVSFGKAILVTLTRHSYLRDDGVLVLSPQDFIARLWSGKIEEPEAIVR
jgi:predicted AAA+ superfamily ATPase